MNAELDIMCPRCRHAIPRGRGCLWVSYTDERRAIAWQRYTWQKAPGP